MRSPRDMGIIEIDITNACVHQCANCTRFCGHHERPFFMSFDKFKQAVDSLDGYDGMIGIIGGEPTLHPEFERFVDYIREKRVGEKINISKGPITDMQYHIYSTVDKGMTPKSRTVLLSSLSTSYYNNFEAINDTFSYQLLNDHSSESLHQALLMSRRELPITDEEWMKKRDNCWIQNTWSATVTPKGAFFCEVAGSLDMLLGREGGWDVESGWWKRKPSEFGDQLHWCEMCSGCLDVPKRLAHDERDDVTPKMYEKLKSLSSPKVRSNRVVVRRPEDYEKYKDGSFTSGSEYIEAGNNIRISKSNRSLYPKEIIFLPQKSWIDDIKSKRITDWVVLADEMHIGTEREKEVRLYIENHIWNPGCVYIIDSQFVSFCVKARSVRDAVSFPSSLKSNIIDYYCLDKRIYLSMDDPLVDVIGGDDKEMMRRGSRKGKKILVYGAGRVGKATVNYMDKCGIVGYDVVVSQKGSNELQGHHIHEIGEYVDIKDDVLVIIATGAMYHDEIVRGLADIGIFNYRFIA